MSYFPKSEVNLISIAELATLFPDENGEPDKEGTYIISHRSKSVLTWNHNQFKRTLYHARNKIPEMPINNGYDKFYSMCSVVNKI